MEEKRFMCVEDVQVELNTSKSNAYKIMRELNDELEAMGYMVVKGRINREFFKKRFCYKEED